MALVWETGDLRYGVALLAAAEVAATTPAMHHTTCEDREMSRRASWLLCDDEEGSEPAVAILSGFLRTASLSSAMSRVTLLYITVPSTRWSPITYGLQRRVTTRAAAGRNSRDHMRRALALSVRAVDLLTESLLPTSSSRSHCTIPASIRRWASTAALLARGQNARGSGAERAPSACQGIGILAWHRAREESEMGARRAIIWTRSIFVIRLPIVGCCSARKPSAHALGAS
ncbi:hypothetical protein DFH09DRAFT_1321283 [Mycena vulgaris]|nr:hypothetical protein DFH09DRAFT_1321283 [Mycena vulgaris]